MLIYQGSTEVITASNAGLVSNQYDDIRFSGTSSALDTASVESLYFSNGVGLVEDRTSSKKNGKLLLERDNLLISYHVN